MSFQYGADDFAPIELKSAEDGDVTELVTKALGDFSTTVKEMITKANERVDHLEAKLNRPAIITKSADDEPSIEQKAFNSYMRRGERSMPETELKALTVATDANGGYLVPDQIGNEIIKKLIEYSPIRQYARTITIGSDAIKYPRRVSGTAATWVGEIDARTASAPVFEQITLTPYELATYTDVSNQLLEDNAFNLEGELTADFGEAFGKAESAAFVVGTGTGQPKGLLAAAGIAEVKTGVAAAFPATNPADVLIGMYHKLPTTHAQNGAWLMNRNTLATMRTWKDTTGRYLVLDPISAGMPVTLLGRPIVEAVDMPDIAANAYPIMFGDLQGYRIVDRIGLTTMRDPYTLATVGQTRFHVRRRVGGDITHPDRFVKLKVSA